MTDKVVKLTIKSLFIWVVMSITTFSLAVLSSLAVYTQIKTYRHELESNALMLAKLVASSSAMYLYDETPERLAGRRGKSEYSPPIFFSFFSENRAKRVRHVVKYN